MGGKGSGTQIPKRTASLTRPGSQDNVCGDVGRRFGIGGARLPGRVYCKMTTVSEGNFSITVKPGGGGKVTVEIEQHQGLLEYELYRQSQMAHAKIKEMQ